MVKIFSRQSILDVAAQASGSVEAVFILAQENGISVTDNIASGQDLIVSKVMNRSIVEHYSDNDIKPATASESDVESAQRVFFEELPVEFT